LKASQSLELMQSVQFFGHNFHHRAPIEPKLKYFETRLLHESNNK